MPITIVELQRIIGQNKIQIDRLTKDNAMLNKDKLEADQEIIRLNDSIKNQDSRLEMMKKEQDLERTQFSKRIEDLNGQVDEKEVKIKELNKIIEDMRGGDLISDDIQVELTRLKVQNREQSKLLEEKIKYLIDARNQIEGISLRLKTATSELESIQKLKLDLEIVNKKLQNEIDQFNKRFKGSFTTTEMYKSLNTVIESFNNEEGSNPEVNYIINGMDINLKAQIYKNDVNEVIFVGPDAGDSGENSISTISFSIKAVPKL